MSARDTFRAWQIGSPDEVSADIRQRWAASVALKGGAFSPDGLGAVLKSLGEWTSGGWKARPLLILTGMTGCGKTTAAKAVAEHWRELRRSCSLRLRDFRAGKYEFRNADTRHVLSALALENVSGPDDGEAGAKWTGAAQWCDAANSARLPQVISTPSLLVVDDLGGEQVDVRSWGNTSSPVVRLICERYEEGLPTLFTTNLTLQAVCGRYGDRVADRLRERGAGVVFPNRSYRREAAPQGESLNIFAEEMGLQDDPKS